MKTLITGAGGFVGRNLIPYLDKKGLEVMPLSLRGTDWEQLMPPAYKAVVHLAGKAHDTSNTSMPEEYFSVNTDLTRQLFDHFLQVEAARDFIYFSSVKAVADTVDGVLAEDIAPAPATPYGQSKWQAEQYLLSQALPEGKRLFILRPCMIHGPGNKGNLNLLYKVVSRGIPWPLATFDNRRSFLSVDNLLFVVEQLLQQPDIAGGVYNLADDESLSTNTLVSLIATSIGRTPYLLKIPAVLVKGVAKIGDVLPLPLNSERLKKLTEDYRVSNTKIKTALGIHHLPVTAGKGMERTLKSFR